MRPCNREAVARATLHRIIDDVRKLECGQPAHAMAAMAN